jgi:hypothetical protein
MSGTDPDVVPGLGWPRIECDESGYEADQPVGWLAHVSRETPHQEDA